MNVLLVTFYDERCTGLRILAASLLQAGHNPHLCLIKKHTSQVVRTFSETHRAYQIIADTGYLRCMSDAHPITKQEEELFFQYIRESRPDVIGLGLRSYLNDIALHFIQNIRRHLPSTKIICGGFGPTLEPEVFTPYVDAVIRGEGEEAIVDFCNAVAEGRDYTSLPNVSAYRQGKTIHMPLRALQCNISRYPWPLSHHDGNDRFLHIDHDTLYTGDPLATWKSYCFLLGRGCVGSCSYCSGGNWLNAYKQQGFKVPLRRLREVDDAMGELKRAKADGYTRIHFTDEYMAAPPGYLNEFFDRYEQEVNLPVEMYLHYLQIIKHPELLQRLARLGLQQVCLGIPSGSERFAQEVYHRHISQKDLLHFAFLVKNAGISLNLHIIIGNPLESENDFHQTLRFLHTIPFDPYVDSLTCFRFTPFPGSPIVRQYGSRAQQPVPQKYFEWQGCLTQLRMLLPDEQFLPLLHNPFYKEHPHLLQEKYYSLRGICVQEDVLRHP